MSNDTKKPRITKESGKEYKKGDMVINQIVVRPVDRSPKDISTVQNGLTAAESPYYPNRTRLYDLYDDIQRDGHLTGIISKRIDAVLNKTIYFEKAGKKVDEMDDVIQSEVFQEVIAKILESKFWGISGLEFIPGAELCFEEIPRKHIKPEKGVIAIEQSALEGSDYEGVSNIWVIGKKKDLGLLLKCAPYALWKRGDMADWAQYVEIFGQPVRIMKYDAYDLKTKMELQEVVNEAGSSLALLIPKQADFDMKDGKQSNGDGALQEKLMNACNNEMSVIILTNTETTTSSASSGYAQAKEHGKQQIEVSKSDLKFVKNKLNSTKFLNILKSYGLPVEGGRFVFKKEFDINVVTQQINVLSIVSAKVPVDDDTWYDTAGLSKPANYNELKAKMDEEKQAIATEQKKAEKDNQGSNGNSQKDKSGNKGGAKDKNKQKLSADQKQSFWNKLRAELADFFDPAHKD